jgi:hypothetical protein
MAKMKKKVLPCGDVIPGCEDCGSNSHFDAGLDDKYPCGQYHCWYECEVCRNNRENENEERCPYND